MNRDYDLIVIGGGPGGTAAAITAARSGARVLLLERGRFPRHKVCGEFVSTESLTLLHWLLGIQNHPLIDNAPRLQWSRLFLDGRTVRVPIEPAAASIARHDLDLALWRSSHEAGVVCRQETTAQAPYGDSPCCLSTSAGEFRASAIINASGRWSNLKPAQPVPDNERWLGLKAHFHTAAGWCTESSVDLYFFEGGYCGVQPVRGDGGVTVLNACALVRAGVADRLTDALRLHPQLALRSEDWRPAFPSLSTFPVVLRQPVPVLGTICQVGDAAGFVDPFVGNGISLALRGGYLAALKILPFILQRCTLQQSLDEYAEAYQRTLLPVYRNSSLLRRFLGFPRGLRRAALSACEMSPRLAACLVQATRSKTMQLDAG